MASMRLAHQMRMDKGSRLCVPEASSAPRISVQDHYKQALPHACHCTRRCSLTSILSFSSSRLGLWSSDKGRAVPSE
eukprot:scaffold127737_cov31-Tisochrysis_lutea.AAC.3